MQQDPDTQKNLYVAIALSIAVLFAWQYFFAPQKPLGPPSEQTQQQVDATPGGPAVPRSTSGDTPQAPLIAGSNSGAAGLIAGQQLTRNQAMKASPRIAIATPSLSGSISLQGGRIDDLSLVKYRTTADKDSDNVVLFSPANAPDAYFAEHGWSAANPKLKVPNGNTIWKAQAGGPLTPTTPVILTFDNGQGLTFRRTISVDADYMFNIRDDVVNASNTAVNLFPYARIFRAGMPKVEGFFILHEGLIGVLGDEGLEEITYADALSADEERCADKRPRRVAPIAAEGGWLGMTDKYWAAVLIPEQTLNYNAKLYGRPTSHENKANCAPRSTYFQAEYVTDKPITVAAGGTASSTGQLFAGAKKFNIIEAYHTNLKIKKFELMVDWGWFWFITQPLHSLIQWLYQLMGNFGLAILATTVLVKAAFFPLANKSYESMSKMKKLQPQMEKLKERCGDDKARLQKEMMELYKTEKVNPMSGCLPILLQIPVFFALYKVLFVTIDMRHAPFFGWIQDLSAPDPTSIFNLFGALPWDSPSLIPAIGVWPLIMGATMWFQMQLNPQQPDPIQQKIFNWMPVMFTFLLASFPAGLVIYWAWNNLLSIIQQSVIMAKQGVEIPLMKNIGLDKYLNKTKNSSS